MSRIALLAAVAFAAFTGTAHAGGWATVELGAMPSGLAAGEPWQVELIVKQHGVTPLAGVTPRVRIDDGAGTVRTFTARPTAKAGHYVADVTFPAGGTWSTRIFDGFNDEIPHRLAPLTVAGPVASPAEFPWHQTVAIAIVALLFLGGILMTVDRPLPRWHGTVTLRGRAA
jgi:hypothetical protein